MSKRFWSICAVFLFCGVLGAADGERITITLPGGVKLDMVMVEAGTFTMGVPDGERNYDESPHQVTLTRDYYIGRTEVTQAQWRAVMGDNPSCFKGDDRPVEQVSWDAAMEFCKRLNRFGKAPKGWKFTLPTEAQWEFAARGGNKSRGFFYSGGNEAREVAWVLVDGTHPVAGLRPNELGLYDMSGNVSEWCLDWYEYDYACDPEFLKGNSGDARVYRGSNAVDIVVTPPRHVSSDRRQGGPARPRPFVGFRLALVRTTDADPAPAATSSTTSPNSDDITLTLPDGVKMTLVKVEAGTFTMGSPSDEEGRGRDERQHRVTLTRDFYIARTEVTQAQGRVVMGEGNQWNLGDDVARRMSWERAMKFCASLNLMGLAPKGWKFTLPTEAQWEYAARGGRKSRGFRYSGSNDAGEVAWHKGNTDGTMQPVARKKPNELGLYDMSGNVWEWCLDWYTPGYSDNPEFLAYDPDFECGARDWCRVIKGGGVGNGADASRVARRYRYGDSYEDYSVRTGMRVVLVQDRPPR